MFTKSFISAIALAATASAAFAMDAPSPGEVMLANLAGVEPGVYSVADTVRLQELQRDTQNSHVVRSILNEGQSGVSSRAAIASPSDDAQLSGVVGVAPGTFTLAELVRIENAQIETQDRHIARFLTNGGDDNATGSSRGSSSAREQIAAGLNIDAGDFTLAQLVRLDDAAADNNRFIVQAILDEAGVSSVTATEILR